MSAGVYGARLRREMARQGWTNVRLMEETGLAPSYIQALRAGRAMPRLAISEKVAEALMAPSLHELVMEARTRSCAVCQAAFITDMKSVTKRLYCGKACAQAAHRDGNLERYRSAREANVKLATYRLMQHQDAIQRHCWDCEPMGRCQTPECALREVSPLPLAVESVA